MPQEKRSGEACPPRREDDGERRRLGRRDAGLKRERGAGSPGRTAEVGGRGGGGGQGGGGGGLECSRSQLQAAGAGHETPYLCHAESADTSSAWGGGGGAPQDFKPGNKVVRDVFLTDYASEEAGISFRKGRGNSAGEQ